MGATAGLSQMSVVDRIKKASEAIYAISDESVRGKLLSEVVIYLNDSEWQELYDFLCDVYALAFIPRDLPDLPEAQVYGLTIRKRSAFSLGKSFDEGWQAAEETFEALRQ